MPRNEEGEFELVLGNRQLLSVFFIVIILMGVCFAMGYIIGRNSLPANGEMMARNRKEAPAIVVEPNGTSPAAGAQPSTLAPGQVSIGGETAPVSKPAPIPAEPIKTPAESKPASKAEPALPPESAPVATAGRIVEPAPGLIFLQVLAVGRADAELTVETLGKKGFRAVVAPGPSEKLFRVLVGPLKDQAEVAKTRTELEGVGFRSPIVRKY